MLRLRDGDSSRGKKTTTAHTQDSIRFSMLSLTKKKTIADIIDEPPLDTDCVMHFKQQ